MASPTPAGSQTAIDDVDVAGVYEAYRSMSRLALSLGWKSLAHRLLLCEPISTTSEVPLIAASIASAGSICIEPSPDAVRLCMRNGAADFIVNSLSEALRALKNEIRKGLPIAICLEGDPAQTLLQMDERGVQPDVICVTGSNTEAFKPFLERGAHLLPMDEHAVERRDEPVRWLAERLPGKWLPLVDELALSCLPAEDQVRRHWVKQAPRYLGRSLRRERFVMLNPLERRYFVEKLEAAAADPSWAGMELTLITNDGSQKICGTAR